MGESMLNYIAILVAAVAAFFFGWGWYAVFGNTWMKALGWSKEDCEGQKMPLAPMAICIVADLVAAFGIACLSRDLGIETVLDGAILGLEIGIAFIVTSMAANNAFQKRKQMLTAIDAGHWTLALALEGAIIAAFV